MSDDIFRELDKIHAKVDKLGDKMDYVVENIGELKVTAARHDVNLENHMQRSNTLEALYDSLAEEMKPIKKHMNYVEGVMKFIGGASMVSGVIYTALKLFGKI